ARRAGLTLGDRAAEPVDERDGVGLGAPGRDQRELLAAVAREAVGGAQATLPRARHLGQQPVAGGMAVGVVERLEVVEVEHRERDRVALALGTLELARELLVERAPVADP